MVKYSLFFILSFVVACGTDSAAHDNHEHHGGHDHSGHASEDDASRDNADTYVAGLEKVGSSGNFTLRLIDSVPTIHSTDVYTWQLMVFDSDGQPVSRLNIQAEPTMPEHGHGTEPRYTEGTPGDEDGLYELKDMDLYMEGMWNVMIHISSNNGTEDMVAFNFHLEDSH